MSESLETRRQRARDIILRYGWNAMCYQLLNPGFQLWFSPVYDAVVGYVESSGYRVVAGAPVCATECLPEVVQDFERDTAAARLKVCYFGAQDRLVLAERRQGPTAQILLGAQPCWQPEHWIAAVTGKASLRAQLARARNKQVQVTRWPNERAATDPALARCLDEWLETRGLPPMRFLVEPNTLSFLLDREVFVAERNGQPIGFLVASPVRLRNGWLIEQIIRGHAAPNGTNELLLDTAMRMLSDGQANYVTLGLSPLSRRAEMPDPSQPLWLRLLLGWIRQHGRRFYNFDGLDTFKAKFQPEFWEPIYAVVPEARMSFGAIYAIAGAFGGMSPVRFVSWAILRAVTQEFRWLQTRRCHAAA